MWQAPGVVAVLLDVTKRGDVEALARRLEGECPQGLYALVNNAGIYSSHFFHPRKAFAFEM
jgi:NAD(P)-dependent dehydrogenase (short-subunit alcohol dehydrogenase family)